MVDKGCVRADEDTSLHQEESLMTYSAAVMYGGATAVGLLESAILGGGQSFSLLPSVGAFVLVALLVLVGLRLPLAAIAALGRLVWR